MKREIGFVSSLGRTTQSSSSCVHLSDDDLNKRFKVTKVNGFIVYTRGRKTRNNNNNINHDCDKLIAAEDGDRHIKRIKSLDESKIDVANAINASINDDNFKCRQVNNKTVIGEHINCNNVEKGIFKDESKGSLAIKGANEMAVVVFGENGEPNSFCLFLLSYCHQCRAAPLDSLETTIQSAISGLPVERTFTCKRCKGIFPSICVGKIGPLCNLCAESKESYPTLTIGSSIISSSPEQVLALEYFKPASLSTSSQYNTLRKKKRKSSKTDLNKSAPVRVSSRIQSKITSKPEEPDLTAKPSKVVDVLLYQLFPVAIGIASIARIRSKGKRMLSIMQMLSQLEGPEEPDLTAKPSKVASVHLSPRKRKYKKISPRISKSVLLSKSFKNATPGISSHKTYQWKITTKDQRLHRLVFEEGGLPDGTELAYYARGQKLLGGYKMGFGILCHCCNCEVSPSTFKAHAGWATRKKPYACIYTSNGVSLHDLAISLSKSRKYSSQDNDDLCIICADGGDLLICDGCPRAFHKGCASLSTVPSGNWYCQHCQNTFQRETYVEHNANAFAAGRVSEIDSVEQITKRCFHRPEEPDLTAKPSKVASVHLSPRKRKYKKISPRDQRLHRLVFEEGGLPDGTELAYYARGQKLLGGYKMGFGILCHCCNCEVSPSTFKAHAGWATRKKPYACIYTSNGVSLHDLAISLSKSRKYSSQDNDDLCIICADGGDLLICDGCPRAFHKGCASLSTVPSGNWYCQHCQNTFQRETYVEHNANAFAAGRVSEIDSVEQITKRCFRIVKNLWLDISLVFVLCRGYDFMRSGFGPRTIILCDQCEKEFHVGCLRSHKMANLKTEEPDLTAKPSKVASVHLSPRKRKYKKISPRDQRLHRLVFEEGGLPDGTELAYYARGQVSPSTFKAHAGWATRKKPYACIYTSNGVSLHDLAISLSKSRKYSSQDNDDLCIICADGGDLLICDGCPRAFHKGCASLSTVPSGNWYCQHCQNTFQRETYVEHNANAFAAGRVSEIDSVEQITKRCFRIVKNLWLDISLVFVLCRGYDFMRSGFGPRTIILCDQCEKEFHVGCLRSHKMANLKRLHRLVFEEGGLPDGTELAYYARGQKLLGGYKMGFGILCHCCNCEVSPSTFKAHAGWATRKKPYACIYTSNGVSLHDLAISLSKSRKYSSQDNDDLCIICADGGDLLICDGCPRAFHKGCASLSTVPSGNWCCQHCQNTFQRETYVEHNANAFAAGRVSEIDSVEQITKRCFRIVKNLWLDISLVFVLCRGYDFMRSGFGPRTIILCDQCEKEFHVGCLRSHKMANLKELPKGNWFCCMDCSRIHSTLQKLRIRGAEKLPDSLLNDIKKQHEEKGLNMSNSIDVRWMLLSGKIASPENKLLLSRALSIFQECFDPIVDSTIGRDLIPLMVYGSALDGRIL
ncbi:hypothetical protein D5086_029467 [Populus alba]|uniref:Uncharacterized protein n=1 Tax=Populus alba TaxID=43335 RepID=A0ACC4ATL5_POPAL